MMLTGTALRALRSNVSHGWGAACSLHTSAPAQSAEHGVPEIQGAYTPITKLLWKQRLQWLEGQKGKPLPSTRSHAPKSMTVTYPLSTDPIFKELYSNPW